jgi:hypothetical protein
MDMDFLAIVSVRALYLFLPSFVVEGELVGTQMSKFPFHKHACIPLCLLEPWPKLNLRPGLFMCGIAVNIAKLPELVLQFRQEASGC